MGKNNNWIFLPTIGLGPFVFGMGMNEAKELYFLNSCGDLSDQLKDCFGDLNRERKFEAGYATSYKSALFDVEFEFDKNDHLETIYSHESFIIYEFELIGSSVECLNALWNWQGWSITDAGVCEILECPGNMQITIDNKKITGVTVDITTILPPRAPHLSSIF